MQKTRFVFRIQLFPGISGKMEVWERTKRQALARALLETEGFACGAAILIQRERPKKRRPKVHGQLRSNRKLH